MRRMALIKCPECGKDVSSEAESCPYCGYPIKTAVLKETTTKSASDSERNEKEGKGSGCLGTFIAVLICVLLLFGIGMTCSSSSGNGDYNTANHAKSYAIIMVKDNLKSPSTAKFCNAAREMTAKNLTLPIALYNREADKVNTNLSLDEMTYLTKLLLDLELNEDEIASVPGEMKRIEPGEIEDYEYEMGYIVDEEALKQLVIDRFYVKVNE